MNTTTTTPAAKTFKLRQRPPYHPRSQAIAKRLSADDITALKQDAIARWPGVWLHHFSTLLEEEVLSRHGIEFTSTLPEAA